MVIKQATEKKTVTENPRNLLATIVTFILIYFINPRGEIYSA